jgi:hypothetical protein
MKSIDTSDKALLAMADRLSDESLDLQRSAWARHDGGQDCSISAMLADEVAVALRAIVAERQAKPAAGDVIEMLARAMLREFNDTVQYEELHPEVKRDFDNRATALHAKIAPALRADGIEMAAGIARGMSFPMQDSAQDAIGAPRAGELVARAIEAKAKRLREGGEG